MTDLFTRVACNGVTEVLAKLTAEVDAARPLDRVKVEFHDDGPEQYTLWLPGTSGRTSPAAAVDLATGLARLLTTLLGPERKASREAAEAMFVGPDGSTSGIAGRLRRLEMHATPARVAHLRRRDSSGEALWWLVHAQEDRRRMSGLAGLRSSGLFAGWYELRAHVHGQLRVFLPGGVDPDDDLLNRFCELLSHEAVLGQESAVALLGLHPQGPNDERFYILAPPLVSGSREVGRARADGFESLVLPPRAFLPSAEIRSVAQTVTVVRLEPAARSTDLLHRLAEQVPGRGYRLQLYRTRRNDPTAPELARLRSEQADLDQRIAHLEGALPPRPYLLRFSQRQLAALAHSIYSFRAEALFASQPRVRYAFQATDREPGGFHYLFVDPDAMRLGPDPLLLYEDRPHMKFTLDPSWAGHYHDRDGNRGYVFVPDRMALFPSLHTWSRQDMDAHLREVFAAPPAGDRGRDAAAPRSSFYVFDGEPDDDVRIEVTVLDEAAFGPVGASFHWLSDNLTLAAEIDLAPLMTKAATAAQWKAAAGELSRAARASIATVHDEARRAADEYARDFEAMVAGIETGAAEVSAAAKTKIAAVHALEEQARRLIDVDARRTASNKAVHALLDAAEHEVAQISDRLATTEQTFRTTVERAKKEGEDQLRRVDELIDHLLERRRDLERRLHDLKRRRQ